MKIQVTHVDTIGCVDHYYHSKFVPIVGDIIEIENDVPGRYTVVSRSVEAKTKGFVTLYVKDAELNSL